MAQTGQARARRRTPSMAGELQSGAFVCGGTARLCREVQRKGGDGMDEERETEERDEDEGRCGDDWCELA